MYTVCIHYADGKIKQFDGIETISYFSTAWETITQDNLLTARIPLNKNLYLTSKISNCSVSCSNVTAIEIEKN